MLHECGNLCDQVLFVILNLGRLVITYCVVIHVILFLMTYPQYDSSHSTWNQSPTQGFAHSEYVCEDIEHEIQSNKLSHSIWTYFCRELTVILLYEAVQDESAKLNVLCFP